jgi:hypothetical protein
VSKRRSRKQERRRKQRWGGEPTAVLYDDKPDLQIDDWRALALRLDRAEPGVKHCGNCREFIEGQDPGGRGECLHPGSGILAPWNDTEACAFYEGRRGR